MTGRHGEALTLDPADDCDTGYHIAARIVRDEAEVRQAINGELAARGHARARTRRLRWLRMPRKAAPAPVSPPEAPLTARRLLGMADISEPGEFTQAVNRHRSPVTGEGALERPAPAVKVVHEDADPEPTAAYRLDEIPDDLHTDPAPTPRPFAPSPVPAAFAPEPLVILPPAIFDGMAGWERSARTCGYCKALDRRDEYGWQYDAFLVWSCPACSAAPGWRSPSLPDVLCSTKPHMIGYGSAELRLIREVRSAASPEGVRPHQAGGWEALIPVGGRSRFLGMYADEYTARHAWDRAVDVFAAAADRSAA